MNRYLQRYSFIIQMTVLIFSCGVAWASVASQESRITKLETQVQSIQIIQQDVGVIKESLRWIEKNMGRR